MCTAECRYLGQLLDAEDAVNSIRKGVDVLEQQIATLVRLVHHMCTQKPSRTVSATLVLPWPKALYTRSLLPTTSVLTVNVSQ